MAKIHLETDNQIARALLRPGSDTRRSLLARGQLVGIHYRRLAMREMLANGQGSPNSPFLNKDQRSIIDKKSFSADVKNGQIILSITSPAAEYAEIGNSLADVGSGKPMAIRIKPSKVRRSRGKRGGARLSLASGVPVVKVKGKKIYYIYTKKREAFSGYHLLARAVRIAFRRI